MNNNHNYIPQIDSLRAIAVMSVILFHANIDFYNIDFKDDDHLSESGVNLIMPEFIELLNIIK